MDYEIFTIGGGETLQMIFNAVAAFTGDGSYADIIGITVLLGGIWITISLAYGVAVQESAKWLVMAYAIYGILFVPKITVQITDRLNPLQVRVVDNVPFVLGAFGSYLSLIGDTMTNSMEVLFSLPNGVNYTENGFLFGVDLIENLPRVKVDPTLDANLKNLTKECILPDLLLGRYRYEEFIGASDLLEFVRSQGLSQINLMEYRFSEADANGNTYDLVTCQAGLEAIYTELNGTSTQQKYQEFLNFLFSENSQAGSASDLSLNNQTYLTSLPEAYQYFIDSSQDSLAILNQQIMINNVYNAAEDFGSAYQQARTDLQTLNTYQSLANSARESVPILRIIVEALIYGLFPVIFPLMLLPNMGFTVFKSYLQAMVWIQMWGPIYVILHFISAINLRANLENLAVNGITISNQGDILTTASNISAMAGFMVTFVPFIALGLARGGISVMGSLATSMLSPSQAAASDAALEKTTGNMSLANTSMNTHNFDLISGNKHDTSGFYDTGGRVTTIDGNTGTAITVGADGTAILKEGSSQYSIGVDWNKSHAESFATASQNSLIQAKEFTDRAVDSYSSGFGQIVSSEEYKSATNQAGTNFANSMNSEFNEAANTMESIIGKFSTEHNISSENALEYFVGASLPQNFAGFSVKESHLDRNILSDAKEITNSNEYQNVVRYFDSYTRSDEASFTDSNGKDLRDGIRSELDKAKSYENSAMNSFNQSKQFREESEDILRSETGYSQSMQQEFINYWRLQNHHDSSDRMYSMGDINHMLHHKNQYQQELDNLIEGFNQQRVDNFTDGLEAYSYSNMTSQIGDNSKISEIENYYQNNSEPINNTAEVESFNKAPEQALEIKDANNAMLKTAKGSIGQHVAEHYQSQKKGEE